MESQVHLRLRVSSGHWRKDDFDREDVGAGAHEHDHHGLHDDVLQVSYRDTATVGFVVQELRVGFRT